MLLYIIPILRRKLFKPGVIGSCFILTGTFLNKIAIAANGGKMPIYPTFSKITGYYNPEMFSSHAGIHILGTSSTHLKILCDYIDVGYSILSIGDLFIRAFTAIILFYTIKSFRTKPLTT